MIVMLKNGIILVRFELIIVRDEVIKGGIV